MKKLVSAALLIAVIVPAKAQLFSREALGGAVLGGIAGGIIGHAGGHNAAAGIGIGAGAGLLLGALTSSYRRDYYEGPYASSYYQSRPNYAVTGAVLGGVAGGIIGHESGRHTAEGIAIGAGAGFLLGGIAEHELRKRETLSPAYLQPVYVAAPATVLTTTPIVTQAAQPQPQQVTVINNYNYAPGVSSAMSGANALFGR